MEDYKEKYEMALKRARDSFNYPDFPGFIRADVVFPELKESEDEKIRKALVRFHKSTIDIDGIKGEDILAWLEKQSKSSDQIHYWTEEEIEPIINDYLRGVEHYGGMIGRLRCLKPKPIEKQGEQKPILDFKAKDWYVSKVDGKIHDMTYNPADKVEPKFKVKYAGSEYNVLEVKDIAGVTFYGIEDEPNHIDYVKAENCEIISGYAIKENGSPYPTKPAVFSEKKPTAWSEEDEIEIPFGAKDSELQEETYYIPKGFHAEIDDDKVVIKKGEKSANWSDEDEEMYKIALGCIETLEDISNGKNMHADVKDWLKSLKKRIGG